MKIYRGVVGCLLVFFLVLGIIFIASQYDKRYSTDGGTLIWRVEDVTNHSLC